MKREVLFFLLSCGEGPDTIHHFPRWSQVIQSLKFGAFHQRRDEFQREMDDRTKDPSIWLMLIGSYQSKQNKNKTRRAMFLPSHTHVNQESEDTNIELNLLRFWLFLSLQYVGGV